MRPPVYYQELGCHVVEEEDDDSSGFFFPRRATIATSRKETLTSSTPIFFDTREDRERKRSFLWSILFLCCIAATEVPIRITAWPCPLFETYCWCYVCKELMASLFLTPNISRQQQQLFGIPKRRVKEMLSSVGRQPETNPRIVMVTSHHPRLMATRCPRIKELDTRPFWNATNLGG